MGQYVLKVAAMRGRVGELANKLAAVKGREGKVTMGNDPGRLLNVTYKVAQQRGDAYIASELFVLACLDDKSDVGRALKGAGADKARMEAAIDALRGGEKVSDAGAEENRQALEKYTIDQIGRAHV